MRILILHSRYRSGPASGENRVVDEEARLLSEGGHDVRLFDPGVGDPSGVELLRAGARVIWSRKAVAGVRRWIRHFRPDVVHCHNLFPALSPSVLRGVGDRAPLILTLHNYRLQCIAYNLFRDGKICEDCVGRLPWPGVIHGCYQDSFPASVAIGASLSLHRGLRTFANVDLFVAISDFVRDKHIQGGLPSDRIIVKPHFVERSEVRQGPGEHFLYLGRLAPEKGVETLMEAWRAVDAPLIVAGDGPQAAYLRSIAPPDVRFMSTVSPARAQALVQRARAIVVPSVCYEGAGRVVLEGYAAGVPVLASRIGGLPEVIRDDVTGIMLPPGEADAWSAGAKRLLDDSESDRMGAAALRMWKERYSPERGLTLLEDAYQQAIRHHALRDGRAPELHAKRPSSR
jgi:glycosyltransferase involved in cell wall biosynthesis